MQTDDWQLTERERSGDFNDTKLGGGIGNRECWELKEKRREGGGEEMKEEKQGHPTVCIWLFACVTM